MIEIIIDDIDLLTPPFANDEMGDLCGGKITTAAAITVSMQNQPVISGVPVCRGVFDTAGSGAAQMTGRIFSKILLDCKLSIKPVMSGVLENLGIMKKQFSKTIPALGKITSTAAFNGRLSITPLIGGSLKTIALVGCGRIETHICGGIK